LASQIKPKELKAFQQAQVLLSQNNAQAAKDTLLAYSRKNKTGLDTKFLLCMCNAILGNFQEAIEPATLLVKQQAKNIEYLKLLGSLYHSLKKYEQAIPLFERALKINSGDFQTLSNIGSSLIEIKKYDEAESYLKKSLAIQPNQPDALTNYGLLLQANTKLDDAINLHKKALQYSPDHNTALYNLAFALNEKGEFEASINNYLKVLNTSPNHVRALCDIAYVYGKLKQPEKSLPYLQRAHSIDPNDAHIHLISGTIHKLMDNLPEAENSFKEAVRLNPDDQTAKYHLAIISGNNTMTSSPDKYVENLFDGYAETFDEHLTGKLKYKTPELINDMVQKHIDNTKKHKLLDLGCGTGLAGTYLKDISDYMVGIDLSSKMLKKAEQRNLYDELIATGIEQYYEAHEFRPDIVVSADVFVYIGDIANIFKETAQALEDNGLFVFSTEDTQDTDEFMLKESGRFAHNENYIASLADTYGLNLIDKQKTIIRYDADKPIHGQVYLLKK